MINLFHSDLMKNALALAQEAFLDNEVPVGAIIYNEKKKTIIGRGRNFVEKEKQVTAHAEIVALKEACKNENSKCLKDCTIYTTLEPCAMCLTALSNARVKRIYYGSVDKKFGAIEGAINLFSLMPGLYKPECYGGFLEEESSKLLKKFFKKLR